MYFWRVTIKRTFKNTIFNTRHKCLFILIQIFDGEAIPLIPLEDETTVCVKSSEPKQTEKDNGQVWKVFLYLNLSFFNDCFLAKQVHVYQFRGFVIEPNNFFLTNFLLFRLSLV